MTFLTDFADQAVVLPVVVVVAIALAVLGWRRGALVWLSVVGGTLAIVLVLKLALLACEPVFGRWDLHSPSGHTAAAALLLGGLAALLAGGQLAAFAGAMLGAVLIGSSRIELGYHSPPEVLVGATVGIAGATILAWLAGPPPIRRPLLVLAAAGGVAMLVHGVRLPAEKEIRWIANDLLNFVPACRIDAGGPVQARP